MICRTVPTGQLYSEINFENERELMTNVCWVFTPKRKEKDF